MSVLALAEIIRLELVRLWRSGTFLVLTVLSVGWTLLFPLIVRGDGTAEGTRELAVRYSLGGVFALLVICLLGAATGTLAQERARKRLQLTLVRPVRYVVIAIGKICALTLVGAVILILAAATLACRLDLSVPCSHVLSPILPSPREEAKAMYESYMHDPETPEAVRKAGRDVVLRILEQRAMDRYETIPTNALARWRFALGPVALDNLKVRLRFTNTFEMRQTVVGRFTLDDALVAPVSNMTQAVLAFPLKGKLDAAHGDPRILAFENHGQNAVMLRPRKDLALLAPADAFGWNLVRATTVMVAVLAFVIAFGTFLSAALSRPVAMFVALVTLVLSEMCPSVIEQYPDTIGESATDRMGLALTRFAADVTHPISSLSPLEALAKDECVELPQVMKALGSDAILLPLLLAFLSALVMPRIENDL